MAGKVKQMIDSILEQRARGDMILLKNTRTKLMLKGINPDKFTMESEDDPLVIDKLNRMMQEFI